MASFKQFKISKLDSILMGLSILGAVISVISFLAILFTDGYFLQFSTSSSSFKTFLVLYEFPLKTFTATVVLFGLALTIERMKQTEKQIEVITENNRFNNFYKHRDDFINFYKTSIYYQLAIKDNKKVTVVDENDAYFYPIYSIYYYPSYHKFQPKKNDTIIKNEKALFDKMKTSLLNISNRELLDNDISDINEAFELSNFVLSVVAGDSFMVNEFKEYKKNYTEENNAPPSSEETKKVLLLIPLYWRYVFLLELMTFDGTDVSTLECEHFESNYSIFCMEYNLLTKYGFKTKIIKVD